MPNNLKRLNPNASQHWEGIVPIFSLGKQIFIAASVVETQRRPKSVCCPSYILLQYDVGGKRR